MNMFRVHLESLKPLRYRCFRGFVISQVRGFSHKATTWVEIKFLTMYLKLVDPGLVSVAQSECSLSCLNTVFILELNTVFIGFEHRVQPVLVKPCL